EERFDTFNRMCFDSALPRIPIKLSSARTFVGRLQYTRVRDLWGRHVGNDAFVLRISKRFDLPEEEIEDTLIHEMIHYYIAWKGLRDSSTHGRIFRSMMQDINTRYGRHLTISHKSSPEDLDGDTRIRTHRICVSTLDDGRTAVTVCAKTRIHNIRRAFSWSPAIRSTAWYTSTDPWFNRFPRCRTAKIFPVDPDTLRKHLEEARPFRP
ncbi:MAG: SprT-like domain-containing protein, partial [Bacteroidales bacterium]|nr:SprT-like domain-containing protein [Bacteroidales bacterium]